MYPKVVGKLFSHRSFVLTCSRIVINIPSLQIDCRQSDTLQMRLIPKQLSCYSSYLFQSLKPSPHLFAQLSKVIKLSKVQEVGNTYFKIYFFFLLSQLERMRSPYYDVCFCLQVIFGLALLNSFSSDLRGFGKFSEVLQQRQPFSAMGFLGGQMGACLT